MAWRLLGILFMVNSSGFLGSLQHSVVGCHELTAPEKPTRDRDEPSRLTRDRRARNPPEAGDSESRSTAKFDLPETGISSPLDPKDTATQTFREKNRVRHLTRDKPMIHDI